MLNKSDMENLAAKILELKQTYKHISTDLTFKNPNTFVILNTINKNVFIVYKKLYNKQYTHVVFKNNIRYTGEEKINLMIFHRLIEMDIVK